MLLLFYLQFDIWLHLSLMETHWPSLQVKEPEPQDVTFTWIFLESDLTVQGSSFTSETSNSCSPSNREISEEKLEGPILILVQNRNISIPDSLTLVIFLVKPLPDLGAGVEGNTAGIFPQVQQPARWIQSEEILRVEY